MRLTAEPGASLSTQTLEPGDNPLTPAHDEKTKAMAGAWQKITGWAKRHGAGVAIGDPTQNVDRLKDDDRNLVVAIKDGTIYKDTLPRTSPGRDARRAAYRRPHRCA